MYEAGIRKHKSRLCGEHLGGNRHDPDEIEVARTGIEAIRIERKYRTR